MEMRYGLFLAWVCVCVYICVERIQFLMVPIFTENMHRNQVYENEIIYIQFHWYLSRSLEFQCAGMHLFSPAQLSASTGDGRQHFWRMPLKRSELCATLCSPIVRHYRFIWKVFNSPHAVLGWLSNWAEYAAIAIFRNVYNNMIAIKCIMEYTL